MSTSLSRNIADPFVDRIYGQNFDPENPEDRAFIDAVGRLDDAALDLGLITPNPSGWIVQDPTGDVSIPTQPFP